MKDKMIVILSCLCLILGVFIYSKIEAKSEIALTNACVVDFEGYELEGKANVNCTIDYDHTSDKQKQFVEEVTFFMENDGTLSNGDIVTLKGIYSEKTANSLNIKVVDSEREYVVTGLIDVYKKYEEIPMQQSVYYNQESKKFLKTYLQAYVENNLNTLSSDILSIDLVGSYYHFNEESRNGTMYLLYRVHSIYDKVLTIDEKHQYFYVEISDIHSQKAFHPDLLYQDMNVSELLVEKKRKKDQEAIETLIEIIHNNIEIVNDYRDVKIYDDKSKLKLHLIFENK